MNGCGSGCWMGICEPSLALSIVSGSQTDALVSDYNSKNKSSTGQKARWQAPAVEWLARRIFALSITQSRGNSEHLSTHLRELANTSICLPEIGFANQNYSGCVEPLRAAIEYGACLIDTAGEYGTEEIVGRAIQDQRDREFLATKLLPRKNQGSGSRGSSSQSCGSQLQERGLSWAKVLH